MTAASDCWISGAGQAAAGPGGHAATWPGACTAVVVPIESNILR